ncbi:MAG: hypothetical protein U0133_03780 [Gemmatimonadales bacterium]
MSLRRAAGWALVALALGGWLGAAPARLVAQDSTAAPRDSARVTPPTPLPAPGQAPVPGADSAGGGKPPVTPMGALWRSILIPGWGQARLNRKLTGALFIAWEGVTLGMSLKTSQELRYLERTNSAGKSAKRKERQDWLVLMGFNHLFAAVEGYVSAHLWDFPPDLDIGVGPLPGGGVGARVSMPVRFP